MEQESCCDARGLGPDSGADVVSDRSRQMNDLHNEMKSRVISSRLSEQYEGHIHPSSGSLAERTKKKSIQQRSRYART
ncbi:hypothetical protein P3S68_032611 [Capsicum galapagoense]